MNKFKFFCLNCDVITSFDEEGYCNCCGKHADNVAKRDNGKIVEYP